MESKILESFDNVFSWHYNIYPGNRLERFNRYIRNGVAKGSNHICVTALSSPVEIIQNCSERYNKPFYDEKTEFGSKIFISGKCKLPRDLARKAYQITLSKDKADYIVIPDVKLFGCMKANIAIKDVAKNNIHLITFSDFRKSGSPEGARQMIIHDCTDNGDVVLLSEKVAVNIWFVPNVDEYVEILNGSDRRYVSDRVLPLIPDNKVSVQTLDMWRRLIFADTNMFEKSLINSDAGEYPFTTWLFLKNEGPILRYSEQCKWFLRSIGIKTPRALDMYDWKDRVISDKDWNMMSKWLMYNLGADENGGFVNIRSNKYSSYNHFLRHKLAVAPIKADKPMLLSDFGICV